MDTPFGDNPLAIVSAQYSIPEDSPYTQDLHAQLERYMYTHTHPTPLHTHTHTHTPALSPKCIALMILPLFVAYLLTSDPELRPSIWQVCEVVSRITGTTNHVTNVFVSTLLLVYPVYV